MAESWFHVVAAASCGQGITVDFSDDQAQQVFGAAQQVWVWFGEQKGVVHDGGDLGLTWHLAAIEFGRIPNIDGCRVVRVELEVGSLCGFDQRGEAATVIDGAHAGVGAVSEQIDAEACEQDAFASTWGTDDQAERAGDTFAIEEVDTDQASAGCGKDRVWGLRPG
ncbi:MAG: hypothetical protein C4344_07790 [Acidimicrobiia bacterium]